MIKCNFSKAAFSRPKTYNFAIKEIFTILILFFFPDNATVVTSYMQGDTKREHYQVVYRLGLIKGV